MFGGNEGWFEGKWLCMSCSADLVVASLKNLFYSLGDVILNLSSKNDWINFLSNCIEITSFRSRLILILSRYSYNKCMHTNMHTNITYMHMHETMCMQMCRHMYIHMHMHMHMQTHTMLGVGVKLVISQK